MSFQLRQAIVRSKIFMLRIWTIFNLKKHTCETCARRAIEIDEREIFQDNFINTLSCFPRKISKELKQIRYGDSY